MKKYILSFVIAIIQIIATAIPTNRVFGAEAGAFKPEWLPPINIDSHTQKVLDAINNAGAHDAPQLPLRVDNNYAKISQDIEPFGTIKPFKEHFLSQLEYTGPGRSIPEPNNIETVKIGFIGPISPTTSVAAGGGSHEENLGVNMLKGAQLAIEQANAAGGYVKRGIPFELVVVNDNGLWGASGNEIIKFAYQDNVWAILGTIDGANSHIAIRAALKAEIVVMNSGDTDPTFIETNIPWVFRCVGDDRRQGSLLIDYLYRHLNYKRVGLLRSSNRYGRFGVREVRDACRRLGSPVPIEMAYPLGCQDYAIQISRLKDANVEAIIHWGDAADGARALNQIRLSGMDQPFYASDRCLSDEFIRMAGENALGVICASPWNPASEDVYFKKFKEEYMRKYNNEPPETYAAHAYDGISMLVWAIQVAGLNRAKIRDVLAYRAKEWHGVTGNIMLSACMDDTGEVFLAKREKDNWSYYSSKDFDHIDD